jgi:hypothetical protein
MKYLEADVTLYMRIFLIGYTEPKYDISSPRSNSNGINWTLYDLCSWQSVVKYSKEATYERHSRVSFFNTQY